MRGHQPRGLTLTMRLVRKRLKDGEVSERKQVGDAESLLATSETPQANNEV